MRALRILKDTRKGFLLIELWNMVKPTISKCLNVRRCLDLKVLESMMPLMAGSFESNARVRWLRSSFSISVQRPVWQLFRPFNLCSDLAAFQSFNIPAPDNQHLLKTSKGFRAFGKRSFSNPFHWAIIIFRKEVLPWTRFCNIFGYFRIFRWSILWCFEVERLLDRMAQSMDFSELRDQFGALGIGSVGQQAYVARDWYRLTYSAPST